MIKWEQVTGFDRDDGNARKSEEKHGISQAMAEQVFFNEPLLVLPDPRHSQLEPHYHALHKTDGDLLLHITFTLRAAGTLIRVIFARCMHQKEKKVYEQTKKNTS